MAMVAKSASGTAVSDIINTMCENKHTGRFAARKSESDYLHSGCIILMKECKLKVCRMREVVHVSLLESCFRTRDIPIAWVGRVLQQLSRDWGRIPGWYLARIAVLHEILHQIPIWRPVGAVRLRSTAL